MNIYRGLACSRDIGTGYLSWEGFGMHCRNRFGTLIWNSTGGLERYISDLERILSQKKVPN